MADFIHNSLYHTVGLIVVIINFDPNIVVGFIGTIFGFILGNNNQIYYDLNKLN